MPLSERVLSAIRARRVAGGGGWVLRQWEDCEAAIEARPASRGLGTRALRNTVIVLTAKVVARLIALVTVLYIIHYLPADRYGSFVTLVNYTAIVSVLLDLGFNTLFVREGARHHYEIQRYLRNVMSLRLLMAAVSFVLLAGLLRLLGPRTLLVPVSFLLVPPPYSSALRHGL